MSAAMNSEVLIRSLRPGETEILNDFLYEAIYVPEGVSPPPQEIIMKPELQVYVKDFGSRRAEMRRQSRAVFLRGLPAPLFITAESEGREESPPHNRKKAQT